MSRFRKKPCCRISPGRTLLLRDRDFPKAGRQRTARFTVQHTEVPLVLDADALNLIAEDAEILSGCRAEKILTPHVGELARLLHMTIAECQRDPAGSAGRQPKNTRPAVYERIP